MRRYSHIHLLLFWVVLLFGVGEPSDSTGNNPPEKDLQQELRVTIVFFNDLHGYLRPFKTRQNDQEVEVGGLARMATVVKRIRAENDQQRNKTFLLIAGDILQGTPLSTIFHGRPDLASFNAMGVDALTVGNHEFDFGLDNFLALQKQAKFPFLSANLTWRKDGQLLTQAARTWPLADRLAFTVIGVTTQALLTTTKSSNVENVAMLDPVMAVKQSFAQIKTRGPVILLSHCSHATDRRIAAQVPGLIAIIGGHDQSIFDPYRQVGPVKIFQAFEKGKYLGRLDLSIDVVSGRTSLVGSTYIHITADIVPDPVIDGIIEEYYGQLDKRFKAVIGESAVFLDGERERIRYEETALGNFVTDIMREYTGADIAFMNSGALRASINIGPITLEEVFKMMPYSNEIVILELSGAEIMDVLARSVRGDRIDEDGGFLHLAGLKMIIEGKKVKAVAAGEDNRPLDLKKRYSVAINSFMASGGDGYRIFIDKPKINTRMPLRELIVDAISRKQKVASQLEGRIIRLGLADENK